MQMIRHVIGQLSQEEQMDPRCLVDAHDWQMIGGRWTCADCGAVLEDQD